MKLDADARFEAWLPSRGDGPEAPRFTFRVKTVRQAMEIDAAIEAIGSEGCRTDTQVYGRLRPLLERHLQDWRKVELADGREALTLNDLLLDALTPSELVELCVALQWCDKLTATDLKKSGSPQSPGPAASAHTAGPGSSTDAAPTGRDPAKPNSSSAPPATAGAAPSAAKAGGST